MPRHKRAQLNSGMRVPLMVFQKMETFSFKNSMGTNDQLVNFADFGQTVLSLLG